MGERVEQETAVLNRMVREEPTGPVIREQIFEGGERMSHVELKEEFLR